MPVPAVPVNVVLELWLPHVFMPAPRLISFPSPSWHISPAFGVTRMTIALSRFGNNLPIDDQLDLTGDTVDRAYRTHPV